MGSILLLWLCRGPTHLKEFSILCYLQMEYDILLCKWSFFIQMCCFHLIDFHTSPDLYLLVER